MKNKKNKQVDEPMIQIDTSSTPGEPAETVDEIQTIYTEYNGNVGLEPIVLNWSMPPPQINTLPKGHEYIQFEQRYRIFACAPQVVPNFMDSTKVMWCVLVKDTENILKQWNIPNTYNVANPFFINFESDFNSTNFFNMWWSDPYSTYFRFEYWGGGRRLHIEDEPPLFPLVNALLTGAWFSDRNNSYNQSVSDWQNPIACSKLLYEFNTTSSSSIHEKVKIQLIFDVATSYETDWITQQREMFLLQKKKIAQLNGQLTSFFGGVQAAGYENYDILQRMIDYRASKYGNLSSDQKGIIEMVVRATGSPYTIIPDAFYPDIFKIAATKEKYAPFDGKPYNMPSSLITDKPDPERVRFGENIMQSHNAILKDIKEGKITYAQAVQQAYNDAVGNYTTYGYNTDYQSDPLRYTISLPYARNLYYPFSQADFRTNRGATFFQNLFADGRNTSAAQTAVLGLEKAGKYAATTTSSVVAAAATKTVLVATMAGIGLSGGTILVPAMVGLDFLASQFTGYGLQSAITTGFAITGQSLATSLFNFDSNNYPEFYNKLLSGLNDSPLDFGQANIVKADLNLRRADWDLNHQQNRFLDGIDVDNVPINSLQFQNIKNLVHEGLNSRRNEQLFYEAFAGEGQGWQQGRQNIAALFEGTSAYEASLLKKMLKQQISTFEAEGIGLNVNDVLAGVKGFDRLKLKLSRLMHGVTNHPIVSRIFDNKLGRFVSNHPYAAGAVAAGTMAVYDAYQSSNDQSQYSLKDQILTESIIKRENMMANATRDTVNQVISFENALLDQKEPLALSRMLIQLDAGTRPDDEIRKNIKSINPAYTYTSTYGRGSKRQGKIDRKNKREMDELVRFKILLKQLSDVLERERYNMNRVILGKRVVRK